MANVKWVRISNEVGAYFKALYHGWENCGKPLKPLILLADKPTEIPSTSQIQV
jgi:hypothetical protein